MRIFSALMLVVLAAAGVRAEELRVETHKGLANFVSDAAAAAQVDISLSETEGGETFSHLAKGSCDMIFVRRKIRDSEKAAFGRPPAELHFANQAVRVIVNPANKVPFLSMRQIAGIFGGTITNWEDAGGDSAEIVPFTVRDLASRLEGMIFTSGTFARRVIFLATSEEVITETANNPAAVSLLTAYRDVAGTRTVPVGDSEQESLLPEDENVSDGSYPLCLDQYVYYNPGREDDTKKLLDFLFSDQSDELFKKYRFFRKESKP